MDCDEDLARKSDRTIAFLARTTDKTVASVRVKDPALQSLIGRATQLLPYAVIKLRAECNHAPLLIGGAFREPRILFVVRDPADWAASVRRLSPAFANPAGIAAQLGALLSALDSLTRHYDVRICRYEDFRVLSAGYVNALLEWAGHDARLTPAMAAELAGKDAQEGSIVSRASLQDVPPDPAFRDAFLREWTKMRPAALIDRLGL